MEEMRARAERDERVLITTLTKRMAEDLTEYYQQNGLRVRYLHSDIDTLERVALIRDLRLGKFDALIGINLLREGLDLPEVSLVAILDADKEGYLRSATSLIQTSGPRGPPRQRRGDHVRGHGHRLDAGGARARPSGGASSRRRTTREHGITPESIRRSIRELLETVRERDYYTVEVPRRRAAVGEPGGPRRPRGRARERDEGGRQAARLRAGRRAARPIKALEGRPGRPRGASAVRRQVDADRSSADPRLAPLVLRRRSSRS